MIFFDDYTLMTLFYYYEELFMPLKALDLHKLSLYTDSGFKPLQACSARL